MKDYQNRAARTLIDGPGFEISDRHMMIIWCAIGLAGEAGEVAELVKKGIFHQHGLDEVALAKEIGDCIWYLAGICTKAGLDLFKIMAENIEKLEERYPNGFSPEDSMKRVDVDGEKNLCPNCGSGYVKFLQIDEFQPYMNGCGDCFHRWGDIREK